MKKLILLSILLIVGCEGLIESKVQGCLYEDACNFDATAQEDDGSCIFPELFYDCENNCLLETDCSGQCGGSDLTCLGCDGIQNSGLIIDECGECDGDGINVDGYYCKDLNILQSLLDANDNCVDNSVLELGSQTWIDGKLVKLILPTSDNTCHMNVLPTSIGDFNSLDTLSIYAAQNIPEEIGKLTSLSWLKISTSEITALPDIFGNLYNLEELFISGYNLTSLPDNFSTMSNLKNLSITYTGLTNLPDNFNNLEHIDNLYITHNYSLTSLPDNFWNMQFGTISSIDGIGGYLLSHLNLSNNNLETLPANIDWNNECSWTDYCNIHLVAYLDLSHNNLKLIPDYFNKFLNVRIMDLSNNEIDTVPDSFWDLREWFDTFDPQMLDLSNNKISSIPEIVCLDNDTIWFWVLHNALQISVGHNCLSEEYHFTECIDSWGTQDGCDND